jgi:hypothetical protein
MPYRYETHCHTKEGSACSIAPAAELVEFYREMGYSGLCVTDHFTGNSTLPPETPWKERVVFYHDIFVKMRDAGAKHGFKVFFGIEPTYKGNDFLIINPSKEWLLENGDAFSGQLGVLLSKARKSGAFVSHAHPFKEAEWIEYIRLLPRCVDAVEIYNANGTPFINGAAKAYAELYGLPGTAGSDLHRTDQKLLCGLETDAPCDNALDLIQAVKNGAARLFSIERK